MSPCKDNVACEIEDDAMDEMIEALVENVLPDDANPRESRAHDAKEEFIRKTCKEPLYAGAKVLIISVKFSGYLWMDASVSALFQLLQMLLSEGNCIPNLEVKQRKL